MNSFTYKNGQLFAEGVAVGGLAKKFGTPLYVYSRGHLISQYHAIRRAMAAVKPLICYAVKANTSAAIINTLAKEGAGADVVSGGELWRARRAGVAANKIVFAGVGKTEAEIGQALREGILYFTVESEQEIERISAVARRTGTVGRIAMRVNPDVDAKTHKYTSTGKKENKFGVDLERAFAAYELAARLPNLEITSLHMHLGSPIMTIDPYREALLKVKPLCLELKRRFPTFRHIDIGGGLGIPYKPDDRAFDLKGFAASVVPLLKDLGLTVSMEPGRYIVGNAGILVTRIDYVKENPLKKFLVMDAAMNDLIRPALYGSYHGIKPVRKARRTTFGDLVGPVCESGDFFAQERELPAVKQGDLLAVMSAGAYAMSMASNYNTRNRAAEVMVSGNKARLIRRRETVEEQVAGEVMPKW